MIKLNYINVGTTLKILAHLKTCEISATFQLLMAQGWAMSRVSFHQYSQTDIATPSAPPSLYCIHAFVCLWKLTVESNYFVASNEAGMALILAAGKGKEGWRRWGYERFFAVGRLRLRLWGSGGRHEEAPLRLQASKGSRRPPPPPFKKPLASWVPKCLEPCGSKKIKCCDTLCGYSSAQWSTYR